MGVLSRPRWSSWSSLYLVDTAGCGGHNLSISSVSTSKGPGSGPFLLLKIPVAVLDRFGDLRREVGFQMFVENANVRCTSLMVANGIPSGGSTFASGNEEALPGCWEGPGTSTSVLK